MSTELQAQTRKAFALYFADLKDENARDGAVVNKRAEWEVFIASRIDSGDLPACAAQWKCPRSLNA